MEKQLEDIRAIREMMEKSTKFISLSGFSGILAGLTAIAGAAFAFFYVLPDFSMTGYNPSEDFIPLLTGAIAVLCLSIAFAVYFSWRKAKRLHQSLFNQLTVRTLYNLAIPLAAGGVFCLILFLEGNLRLVIAGTLLFYGLALVNVSKYTFEEIHYLGLIEIGLGILAALFEQGGILCWTLGFGVCHILYGYIMYKKYDLKKE